MHARGETAMTPITEGTRVDGRYEVVRRLGRGGMGEVFLGKRLTDGVSVALKVLDPELATDPAQRVRFQREALAVATVTHPNVAQLLDRVGGADGRSVLVFEYVEGVDLQELLAREVALSFDELRTVGLRLAEALEFAHARGVIHRDLKPANVRVRRTERGLEVKLLDFGIADLSKLGMTRLTAEGSVSGTLRYMAPEQMLEQPVDGRADVYSLGLVLFEAATGRSPWAEGTGSLLRQQLEAPLPSLASFAPERACAALDEVLARACDKEPLHRFTSMSELGNALAAVPSQPWPALTRAALDAPRPPSRDAPTAASGSRRAPSLATDANLTQPKPPATPSSGLRAAALVVGLLALVGLAWKWVPGRSATPLPGSTGAPWGCERLRAYDPALADLDLPALEDLVRAERVLPPSLARGAVERLRAMSEAAPPSDRDCAYRANLIASVLGSRTLLLTTPATFGQRHELAALETLYLELPLRKAWSAAERRARLDAAKQLFVNPKNVKPEDVEFEQRRVWGLAVVCDATDAALAQVKATRPPADCGYFDALP